MFSIYYKVVRFFLYPIIYIADFMQNNFTAFFSPMNIGPTAFRTFSEFIKENFKKHDYVLDFGSGTGYFSKLFDKKKYLGVEINKKFVQMSKKKNKNYNFKILNDDCLHKYENKINSILISNVMHHLSDRQIEKAFTFFKKKLSPKTKIFIIEPLLPKTFFSLEFLMKVLDIGNNIKTKKGYLKIFKKCFSIKKTRIKEFRIFSWCDNEFGTAHVLVLNGFLK